jgi:hypothetical protein
MVMNDLNVVFFGIRRGGQHAVINWVAAHFDEPVWFFNDIKEFNNPRPILDDTGATNLPEYIRNPMSIPDVWQIPKKVLFQSYEDRSIHGLNFDANARVIGESRRTICIIILRDLFNTVASRLSHPGPIFMVTPAIRTRWMDYAKEAIGETHHLPNVVFINYNLWFKNETYRRRLERTLGLRMTDRGIENVSGVGSSFSGKEQNGRAQTMRVEERWKNYCNDNRYVNFFKVPQLWELHDLLFGEIAEQIRPSPKIQSQSRGCLRSVRLVYIRTPKTASTTFKNILWKMAEERNLRVLYQYHQSIYDEGLKGKGPFDLSLHHVVFSPTNIARLRDLLPKCQFITSIRDPLERARSHYNHIGPSGHVNRFAEKGVPFSEWYMDHKDDEGNYAGWKDAIAFRHWTNGQMSNFTGFTKPGFTYEHFCSMYAFVLVSEKFELSLRVFEALLDVPLCRMEPVRVATYDKPEIPEEVRIAFRDRNDLDYLLYEYGCRRLSEQAREMNCEDTIHPDKR